jgi:hypothetical protein
MRFPSAAVAVVLASWLGPAEARAHSGMVLPDIAVWRLVIGPGVAYDYETAGGSGVVSTWDTALSHTIFWGAAGFRHVYQPDGEVHILGGYVEGGAWFFVNMGIGYGFDRVHGAPGWSHGFHLFIGEPLQLYGEPGAESGLVIEPYIRPAYFFGEHQRFVFEVGLLVKYSIVLEAEDGEDEEPA